MPQVNLSLSNIYKVLCKECQAKVVDMVKSQMAEDAILRSLEGEPTKKGGK